MVCFPLTEDVCPKVNSSTKWSKLGMNCYIPPGDFCVRKNSYIGKLGKKCKATKETNNNKRKRKEKVLLELTLAKQLIITIKNQP